MIEMTRELLLYTLIGLIFVLIVLIVLIFRKRSSLEGMQKEDKQPRPETGEEDKDTSAIKEKLMKDRLIKADKDGNQEKAGEHPGPEKDESSYAPPPKHQETAEEKNDVTEDRSGDEKPAAEVPARQHDEFDFADLDEQDVVTQQEPEPEAPAPGQPEEEARPGEKRGGFISERVELKEPAEKTLGKPLSEGKLTSVVGTDELEKDQESFIEQTVSVEGDLKLSSKGADYWYVLFDSKGSVVVRSENELPEQRLRVKAKVLKTRLGQLYLDVISHEKI